MIAAPLTKVCLQLTGFERNRGGVDLCRPVLDRPLQKLGLLYTDVLFLSFYGKNLPFISLQNFFI